MTEANDDRRHFSRVPFRADAHVHNENRDLHLHCRVIDLSLNGLLIQKPKGWRGQLDDIYQLEVLLNQGQLIIKMQAEVAHIDDDSIGFHCQLIDLDSIGHLKRLMELNLGDTALLHRELAALLDHH